MLYHKPRWVIDMIACTMVCIASTAWAHPGPRVWIGNVSQQIVTYRSVAPSGYEPWRVFTQPLELIEGTDIYATDFPGYEVRSGGSVPAGTIFGFNVVGPTLKFNPITGKLDEMIQPNDPRLSIVEAESGAFSVTTQTGYLNGFNFFQHNFNGDHAHLFYALNGDGVSLGGGADGVYVLPLEFTSPSLSRSKPYFLVLPKNAAANHVTQTETIALNMANTRPGDANFDGMVNYDDMLIFVANYGRTSGAWWGRGDFTTEGKINTMDFNLLAGNYDSPGMALADFQRAQAALIPEPAAMTAFFLVGASMARFRRSRQHQSCRQMHHHPIRLNPGLRPQESADIPRRC